MTCSSCGSEIIGDGDLACQHNGRALCVVCFMDTTLTRERLERSGLFDMAKIDDLIQDTRSTFDEFRGREIRRRAKREG
jgi:hypothetical protein